MSNVFKISSGEIRDLSAENENLKLELKKLKSERDAISCRLMKETKRLKVARDVAGKTIHFNDAG